MSTYTYKSITDLSSLDDISTDDIILIYTRYTSNYTNNSFEIHESTSDGTNIQQYWEVKGFIN